VHDRTFRVLRQHLPGPYCFILDATREVPRIVQTPRKTVGVRVPNHPVALALAAELGRPIISSTAARHGETPNPDPREIEMTFRGLALVLDAGAGGVTPTSVIDLTGPEPKVVRAGAGDVTPFE
jgi:tRNA threonylcarbamoyl adenosine modification protein (Sua5/YciO/YrdC/YwlC family)